MPKEQVKPIYVLHGDDEYLRDVSRKNIVDAAVGQGDPQLCISQFDSEAELAVILDELRTLPFLAPHRVVIVSQADAFVSAHRDALEKYLESPSATGTLILLTTAWPSNTRLYKSVQKVGQAIDCSVPEKRDLSEWVVSTVAKRGKQIAHEAAEMLAHWVGRDLAAISSEIDKLFLYAADRPTITSADITAIVTATAGPEAFELTNHITTGNAAGALKALSGMLARRGDEFKALGMIGWHLRRALQAQQAIQSGANEWSVLKMPSEQKKPFIEMLRRRGTGRLLNDFRRMLKADLAMKSGADPIAAMQELVVALCR
jgi:DNA polymerase III subunit delta